MLKNVYLIGFILELVVKPFELVQLKALLPGQRIKVATALVTLVKPIIVLTD